MQTIYVISYYLYHVPLMYTLAEPEKQIRGSRQKKRHEKYDLEELISFKITTYTSG